MAKRNTLDRNRLSIFSLIFSITFVTAVFLLSSCAEPKDEALLEEYLMPDTVFINGKVIQVNAGDFIVEAVAIKGGKIIAVGSNKMVKKLMGHNTQVIDLKGLTATPGLIDSHCHFSGTGMLYVLDLSYPAVETIADVKGKVKAMIKTLKAGEWVQGRGWDEGKLSELRYIYAFDLDPVSPNNPVWITHTMGHYGTANSYALKLANINKETPDPPGGTIDRYQDGTPTGVLKESAQSLVRRLIPRFTPEQVEEGLVKIVEEFNKEGMTAVKDPGIGPGKWEAYQKVLAQNKLTVRAFILWDAGKTIEAAQKLIDRVGSFTKPYISTGDDTLISGGIKIYLDGSGGARTAWLYKEWNKNYKEVDKGNYGYPVMDPEIFRKQILMFHNAGLHVSVHAIGDRAIDWVMDSYALALKENPIHGLRHGLIHCNIPTDRAIEMMAEMQKNHDSGYPESQSTFIWWIGDTYAGNFGPERSLRLKPFKTYLEKDIIWGGGSDFSVTPFAARYGLWASIARRTLLEVYGSVPYGTAESVDIHNVLRSYTIWNARQLFMEEKIGSIEEGKYADIAVWDKDMYAIPTDEIKELKCQLTMVGGKIVYKAPETPITIYKGRIMVSQGDKIGLVPIMVFAFFAMAVAGVIQLRRKTFRLLIREKEADL
jgi:predicted amidohydrolase YtcJ